MMNFNRLFVCSLIAGAVFSSACSKEVTHSQVLAPPAPTPAPTPQCRFDMSSEALVVNFAENQANQSNLLRLEHQGLNEGLTVQRCQESSTQKTVYQISGFSTDRLEQIKAFRWLLQSDRSIDWGATGSFRCYSGIWTAEFCMNFPSV